MPTDIADDDDDDDHVVGSTLYTLCTNICSPFSKATKEGEEENGVAVGGADFFSDPRIPVLPACWMVAIAATESRTPRVSLLARRCFTTYY